MMESKGMTKGQYEVFEEAYLQLVVAVEMNEAGFVLSEQRRIKIKDLIQEMFDIMLTINVEKYK